MKLEPFTSRRFVGYLDPRYEGEDLRLLLENPTEVGEFEGADRVPTRPGREVYRLEIGTARGNIVVYTHLLTNSKMIETLRRPQAFQVLRTGRRMLMSGLPTSRVIAAVRPRWMPFNRTSFAVTLAIRDAVPLSSLEADEFTGRVGGFKKSQLIRQVASATAWMHVHGFYHKDLIAQNILIGRRHSTPTVWIVGLGRAGHSIWLPPYLRQVRWASDLRALMRSEVQAFNDRDRNVFLETYFRCLGHAPGKGLMRALLSRL
jgi:hypothetical protein